MVAVVRFAGCMNHMVFVKAGVFCEALFTARHCAHIRFLSWRSKNESDNGKQVLISFLIL